jgi:hypothetical protein
MAEGAGLERNWVELLSAGHGYDIIVARSRQVSVIDCGSTA